MASASFSLTQNETLVINTPMYASDTGMPTPIATFDFCFFFYPTPSPENLLGNLRSESGLGEFTAVGNIFSFFTMVKDNKVVHVSFPFFGGGGKNQKEKKKKARIALRSLFSSFASQIKHIPDSTGYLQRVTRMLILTSSLVPEASPAGSIQQHCRIFLR